MQFNSYLKAGYSLLVVESHEERRVIEEFKKQAGEEYSCFVFDIVKGIRECESGKRKGESEDPASAIADFEKFSDNSILFVKDAHRFMEDLSVVRTIKNAIPRMKATGKHIILIMARLNVPVELEKDATVIEFELPGNEELVKVARELVENNELAIEIREGDIACAKGLTLAEAENAFARSIIETKSFDRGILESEKLQAVRKSGLAEIWPAGSMKEVGGLGVLKRYITNRARGFEAGSSLPLPRGILLAGLPGTGKSLAAKAIAGALEMPLIRLDLGTLKGSLVGESEANMRKATQLIDAISPCVVWLDEIEKSLSGVQSSGKTDGGTGSNMFGQLLTWMQESTAMHYIVATCNDVGELLNLSQGALIRRFDDLFFVDLPNREERKEIYQIMLDRYGVRDNIEFSSIDVESMHDWSGAEIEKFVKNALYDGIQVAFGNIRPIAQQNKTQLDKVREWAKSNAIFAGEEESNVRASRASSRSLNIVNNKAISQ